MRRYTADEKEIERLRDEVENVRAANVLHLQQKDSEIARLQAENEQLRRDNDVMYRAGCDDGYARAGIEVRAKWQTVLDAARYYYVLHNKSDVLFAVGKTRCECDLCNAFRTLDGEVKPAEREG